jgi:hypothetical protein
MFDDGVRAALDVRDKRCAKPRLLLFVVLRRIIELTLSKLMKGDDHSREP